jgi:outer membrane protein
MKEYTEAKRLEAKYKAQSEEKGRQLEAEIKRSNKTLLTFKVKRRQTVKLGHNKKELNYKRATIELCTTSIITTIATRKWNRNGHFSKWSKRNSSKHTVKKKDILISTVLVMLHPFYMLKKNTTLKEIVKALNDKYKAAAKTEEKVEEKAEAKTEEKK